MASWKAPQFFGSITTGVPDANPQTFQPSVVGMPVGFPQRSEFGQCERLWRIRSSGREVLRSSAAPINPLTRQQIDNVDNTPAGASNNPIVHLKKQIKLQSRTGESNFTFDIGQAIELYGFSVDVDILAPAGTLEVSDSVPATLALTATGLVFDAALGIEVLAIETSLGNITGRLTQHLVVLATAQPTIAVPRNAIRLRILQSAVGAASPTWNRFIGDPAVHASLNIGPINFVGRISTLQSTEIGDATHLQTDVDAVNNRFYTLIWEIRP